MTVPGVYLPNTPCEHTIDGETLREVPTHPLTLAEWIAATRLAAVLLAGDFLPARARHLGILVELRCLLPAGPVSTAVLAGLRAVITIAVDDMWGTPDESLAMVDAVVRHAIGTSAGPVFDALATVQPDGRPAARLFECCNALRHHRADAHAAASSVPSPVQTTANRIAARACRPLSTVDRAGLVALLGRLPV